MTIFRLSVHAVATCLLVTAFGAPRAASAQIGQNTPIVSMSLAPAEATITVGQQQGLSTSALLDTGTTVQISGGGSILWRMAWTPGINVSACGTAATQFSSQVFQIDGTTGAFHAVWSPGQPDTLKADGIMSLPTAVAGASVTAALQCVNGAASGSASAFWNATQYDGTFTFGGGGGEVALVGLSWTSSNPAVASVSQAGVVTALAPGDATITATWGNRCWQPLAGENLVCRGTTTATATVHVQEDGGGGGGGEEGCVRLTFVLLPGSEPAATVDVTLVDPPSGAELGSFSLPIGQTVAPDPGAYHLRLSAPPGLTVTPVQRGLNLVCGDDETVRVRFRKAR